MFSAKAFLKYRSKIVKLAEITLLNGGDISGDTKADLQNVRQFKEGTFFLHHSGLTGTSKSLTVAVVTKDPAGSTSTHFHEIANFGTRSSASAEGNRKVVAANMGENIAITWVKGNVDNATTFTVYGVCK